MTKGDNIQERLILFSARIVKMCNAMPRTVAGDHITRQLIQSGTAAATHHSEARSAESPADYVHTLKIVIKELNESEVWIKIIFAAEILPTSRMEDILEECNQLQKNLSASIKTARQSAAN